MCVCECVCVRVRVCRLSTTHATDLLPQPLLCERDERQSIVSIKEEICEKATLVHIIKEKLIHSVLAKHDWQVENPFQPSLFGFKSACSKNNAPLLCMIPSTDAIAREEAPLWQQCFEFKFFCERLFATEVKNDIEHFNVVSDWTSSEPGVAMPWASMPLNWPVLPDATVSKHALALQALDLCLRCLLQVSMH